MAEPQLADPYVTPRTQPAPRPVKYLVIGLSLAVVLLAGVAGSFMVWFSVRARTSRVMINRGPVVERIQIEASRRPVGSTVDLPPLAPEAVPAATQSVAP